MYTVINKVIFCAHKRFLQKTIYIFGLGEKKKHKRKENEQSFYEIRQLFKE